MFNQKTNQFRTFGRAKGKPLSPAQSELMREVFPRLDIGPLIVQGQNPFEQEGSPLWLEIGFGGSEHLLWQAEHNPHVTLLGVEPFLNGVAKAVRGIAEKKLTNVKLHRGDARNVLTVLPDGCLDSVFVLFPDPWPKVRHHKRRIINADFIKELYRVIRPGGRFRFASDIVHYVDWTLTRLYKHGGFNWTAKQKDDWRIRPQDWPSTRYLEKALREGRSGHFFEFIRQ